MRRPRDALARDLRRRIRVVRVAREHHCRTVSSAVELQEAASAVDPCLVPFSAIPIVEVEAGARDACDARPMLDQRAPAVRGFDAVVADDLAGRIVDLPVTEPEIELAMLDRSAGRRLVRRRALRGCAKLLQLWGVE